MSEQTSVTAAGGADEGVSEAAVAAGTADVAGAAGRFRIYLGAAAGVGKTYAMLREGHRRQGRGADVVIGFVECHGRRLTEELIEGLEVVPRKSVEYRGSHLEEMDLDAVLRRQPKIALIDELAHTNVPGSGPHEKRWQDVMDILGAGIDVITTVNIQHLESIADEVEQMTGVKVRERVPDWVVRKADQIELVDSSPEQLRRRMLHGNIYPAERVPQALTHFFRTDNLIALRELALRFLADESEEDLLEYLRQPRVRNRMGNHRAHPGGGHRGPGDRRAAAAGGPYRVQGQGGARRRSRRRRRRCPLGRPALARAAAAAGGGRRRRLARDRG